MLYKLILQNNVFYLCYARGKNAISELDPVQLIYPDQRRSKQ